MKNKIKILGILLFLSLVNLHAQTSYFYYYDGEKQYFELDTKHVFVSAADENSNQFFSSFNATHTPSRADIPKGRQSKSNYKRFWTVLSFEEKFSDEAYLKKLTEIKNAGNDIIVAPYFKNKHQEKIGLSNFLYVKLKSLNDTVLLRKETEKEQCIIAYQNEFMPL